jgi:hypothetical protein
MGYCCSKLKNFAQVIVLVLAICLGTVPLQAWVAGRQVLKGHVPDVVARLKPIGDLAETNRLRLTMGLPLRNQATLNKLLRDLYNPSSPRYRRFLKPDEFAGQFGPSEEDYGALQPNSPGRGGIAI